MYTVSLNQGFTVRKKISIFFLLGCCILCFLLTSISSLSSLSQCHQCSPLPFVIFCWNIRHMSAPWKQLTPICVLVSVKPKHKLVCVFLPASEVEVQHQHNYQKGPAEDELLHELRKFILQPPPAVRVCFYYVIIMFSGFPSVPFL